MKSFTLWLGMYTVTLCLFTYETGNPLKGAGFALIAATLKTVWSVVHHRLWQDRPCRIMYGPANRTPAKYIAPHSNNGARP